MTIKDFKPGQTVFVVECICARDIEYRASKAVVRTVGRDYIKTSQENQVTEDEFRQRNASDNFLVSNRDWRRPAMLFSTENDLDAYIEKMETKAWIMDNVKWRSLDKYNLRQLREIRRILETKK